MCQQRKTGFAPKKTLPDHVIAVFVICIGISAYIVTSQVRYENIYMNQVLKLSRSNILLPDDLPNDRSKNIHSISIIGERNSGTTWMYEHLNKCFNHSISVRRRLTRYKHWFQDENVGNIQNGTLVLSMFRNPYDWFEAMRKKPHHAPRHMFLDWKTFLETPWTMERVGLDLLIDEKNIQNHVRCQEDFRYQDIVSCYTRPFADGHFTKTHFSEHQPFYEMRNDGTGKPFESIFQLRGAKIQNFLNISYFKSVAELWILQYEVLVRYGTRELIQEIESLTGIPSHCTPSPAQERKNRIIDNVMKKYIDKKLDWTVEALIGYEKHRVQSMASMNNTTIFKKIRQ